MIYFVNLYPPTLSIPPQPMDLEFFGYGYATRGEADTAHMEGRLCCIEVDCPE